MREKWLRFAVSSGAPSFSATQAMSRSIVASGVRNGELPDDGHEASALLEGFGVELGADEHLSPHEDAHCQRLSAVSGEPPPGRSVLSATRLPDCVDKEGRVEMNHQEGSRTGLSRRS